MVQVTNRCQVSDEALFQGINVADNALLALWSMAKNKREMSAPQKFMMEHPQYIFAVGVYLASKALDLTYTSHKVYIKVCQAEAD